MHEIEICNLTKEYRARRLKKNLALNNLSLDVGKGEVFGFLGPNGAGKSTTIKLIMGLISPTSGRVFIRGILSTDPASRAKVGYLPENPAFYDFLTAREYLSFVGETYKMSRSSIAFESQRVLDLLDITGSADRSIRSYSKGMVQRLGIAQALLHNPDVYVLDEPMSGLDPVGRSLVKDIIIDLKNRGKSVFFSTHITSDVEKICDRVGILSHGELQMVDKVDNILSRGIKGHTVRFRQKDAKDFEEIFAKDIQLGVVVSGLHASGAEISVVEPVRHSLEDLFIDIVQGGKY